MASDTFDVKRPVIVIPLTHGGAVTTVNSSAIPLNGILEMFKVKSGPVDASATLTINIKDADGDVVYTKAAIAANTTVVTDMTADASIPVSGNYTIQIVTSAAQTATDNTFTVTLYVGLV